MGRQIDRCFCSPQKRARQASEIICKVPVVFDQRHQLSDMQRIQDIGIEHYHQELKEKAAIATKLFQGIAEQKHMILKLNKKPKKK